MKNTPTKGDLVIMNAKCKHVLGKTSKAHVREFGTCIGIVSGQAVLGYPEVDVYWQPSNLRYAYHPKYLKPATRHKK